MHITLVSIRKIKQREQEKKEKKKKTIKIEWNKVKIVALRNYVCCHFVKTPTIFGQTSNYLIKELFESETKANSKISKILLFVWLKLLCINESVFLIHELLNCLNLFHCKIQYCIATWAKCILKFLALFM